MQPNRWDPDSQCCAQILSNNTPRTACKTHGLTLTIHDTANTIQCLIAPKLIGAHGPNAFDKFVIFNLSHVELKISQTLNSVYLLVTKCSFYTAIPTYRVGKRKHFQNINDLNMIKLSLQRWLTVFAMEFRSDPNSEEHDISLNKIPFSEHSALESFGFDNEITALRNNSDNAISSTDDFEVLTSARLHEYDLCDLVEEESDDEYVEYTQPKDTEAAADVDNDEDMEQEENGSNPNKKPSDKEEMDEDEEKQIVEVTTGCTARRVLIDEAMRGNQCDWMHSLYTEYDDIPIKIRQLKVAEITKPHHTPSKSPKQKRKFPSSQIQMEVVVEVKEEEEHKEVQTYSQSSWKSQDILLCDKAVEEHQKQRQRENSEDVSSPDFRPPTYSLTERMKNIKCSNGTNESIVSIVSVQESVGDQSGINLENAQQMNVDDDDEENGEGVDDLDLLDDIEEEEVEDGDDDMDEYVDREYLGELTRSDLDRMHRYFIKIGAKLNANNNNDPDNPLNV